jgi:hypothetical protein
MPEGVEKRPVPGPVPLSVGPLNLPWAWVELDGRRRLVGVAERAECRGEVIGRLQFAIMHRDEGRPPPEVGASPAWHYGGAAVV